MISSVRSSDLAVSLEWLLPSSLRVEGPKNEFPTVEYEREHLQEPCIALEEKEFRSPSLQVKIYALTFIPKLVFNISRNFEEFSGMRGGVPWFVRGESFHPAHTPL